MITLSRHQRLGVLAALAVISIFLFQHHASRDTGRANVVADVSPTDDHARPEFTPGQAKPAGEKYSKTIVMARLKKDDVAWVEKLEGFNTSFYTMDDHEMSPTIPMNKGREAMAYLTYIIDNYDNLPDVAIFFHPHPEAWHNNILLDLDSARTLTRLNPAHVTRQGYFNSRCHHDPGCPDWLHIDRPESEWDPVKKFEEKYFTSEVWHQLHPNDPVPYAVSQPCCAQFAVSGERIRARPRSDYERYRKWLLDTPIEDRYSGRVLEYSWQYIFTGESEFCPSQHKCYCDGYGVCMGGTTDEKLLEWLAILREREILDAQLDELKKDYEKNEQQIREVERVWAVKAELVERLTKEAYKRGESAEERAKECGRPWKKGDGF